jgi:hypothetical protein
MIPSLFLTLLSPENQESVISYLMGIKDRYLEILFSPAENPEMIWLLLPLVLSLLLIEFYFGRYKEEELGWNTAFGNSLVLIFVSIFLAKYMVETGLIFEDSTRLIIVSIIVFLGILLTIIDFFHILPKKIAFEVSSKLPMNFLAYISIILVYTDRAHIPLDITTSSAFILLFITFTIAIQLIHFLAPEDHSELPAVPEPSSKPI